MEFFIKKGATLPPLLLELKKDGRSDYRKFFDILSATTILFSMSDIENGTPRIINKLCTVKKHLHSDHYYVNYQFTTKQTTKIGRYEGYFSIQYDNGLIGLPLDSKIFINIVDSFASENILPSSGSSINLDKACCDDNDEVTFFILTENGVILTTEDNLNIEY